jgi:hypothetical protein
MDVKNNPAGRLYDLLNIARGRPNDQAAKIVWAHVFDVPPEDTGLLLQMLADFIDVLRQAKVDLERLDDINHDLYLKPLKRVEQMLSHINLEAAWQHGKSFLDDTTMYGLQIAADKLSRVSGYSHVDNKDVDALRAELDELLSKALNAALPAELKALFLRNLESLRQALLAYRIRGIEGLHQEIERSYGSLSLHRDQIKEAAAKDASSRDLWKSFFDVIDRLNKLVTFAKNAGELAAPALPPLLNLLA